MANKFYVHNDIFRYEDEVFGDSEAELDEGKRFMIIPYTMYFHFMVAFYFACWWLYVVIVHAITDWFAISVCLESEEEVEEEPEERQQSPEPLQESPNSTTYYEPHPVTYVKILITCISCFIL